MLTLPGQQQCGSVLASLARTGTLVSPPSIDLAHGALRVSVCVSLIDLGMRPEKTIIESPSKSIRLRAQAA